MKCCIIGRIALCIWLLLSAGAAQRLSADTATTNILDGISTNANGPFTLGDTGSFNFLLITNAAALTNTTGIVGNGADAHGNLAIVTGTNSIWNNSGSFVLGATGAFNQLLLAFGGRMKSASATIGSDVMASNNLASLSGAETSWKNDGELTIGLLGANNALSLSDNARFLGGWAVIGGSSSGNQMTLEGGASGYASSLTLGSAAGASFNLLRLDGAGTGLTNSDSILLGGSGSQNCIIVSNSASLYPWFNFPITFTIGDNNTSRSNSFVVTGGGSKYISSADLIVGRAGADNRVIVSEGGLLKTGTARIGVDCACSNNLLIVAGPGTAWTNGSTYLGDCGKRNSLVISNGAHAVIGSFNSGRSGGGGNVVLVDGSDSLLKSTSSFTLGSSLAPDSFSVLHGARFEGMTVTVGLYGSDGATIVTGAGTTWSNASLVIGGGDNFSSGVGSGHMLALADGARMDCGDTGIGVGVSSGDNSVLVSGATTVVNIHSNLSVGIRGSRNRLSIYDGAAVNVANNVFVGSNGPLNSLEIRNGAQLNDWSATIGNAGSATSNSVIVTGRGATWNHLDSLTVGNSSRRAKLIISNRGRVNDETAVIGRFGVGEGGCIGCPVFTSFSLVLVTDPGSIWNNRGRLVVGGASEANSLIISNGATVVAGNVVIGEAYPAAGGNPCAPGEPFNGLTNVGGCLFVTNTSQDAVLEPRFGMLRLLSGVTIADRLILSNCATPKIDFRGGILRVRDTLVTNGAPLVVGDGLRTAHFQIDRLTQFNDTGNLLASPRLVIQPHALLTGAGRLLGPTTNLGTIAPGFPLEGRLFVRAPLGLGPASVLHFDLAGNTGGFNYDYLDATVPLAFDGSLRVTLRNGYVPPPAQVFRVITGPAFSGAFTNVAFGGRLKTTDNLGSFLVMTNINAVELTDYQSTDLDGDGIEDAWANAHFGHSPLTPAERAADADGDGASNYDEFRAGTDPNDPSSVFKAAILYADGRATVSFPCVEGKTYRVWVSAEPGNFTEVTDPTFAYPSAGLCEWTDDGKETGGLGGATRFYRVTVE